MSHTLQTTDTQYETIQRAARAQGRTPDALLAEWIDELNRRYGEQRYYETDDWFRHLGVSDELIEELKQEVRAEAETDADTR